MSKGRFQFDITEIDETSFSKRIQDEINDVRRGGFSTSPPHEEGFSVSKSPTGTEFILRGDPGPPCLPDYCEMYVPGGNSTFHLHQLSGSGEPSLRELDMLNKSPGPDFIITKDKVFKIDNIIDYSTQPISPDDLF